LKNASGDVVFSETQSYVLPLKKFPVKDVNEISRKFCAGHLQKSLGACRVIKVKIIFKNI
jgi:hypothetical protein